MRRIDQPISAGKGSPMARASVDAVKAGNDVLLWPTDLDGAFHGVWTR